MTACDELVASAAPIRLPATPGERTGSTLWAQVPIGDPEEDDGYGGDEDEDDEDDEDDEEEPWQACDGSAAPSGWGRAVGIVLGREARRARCVALRDSLGRRLSPPVPA